MQETISLRQLNAIVFIFLVANFAIFEPRALADDAGGGVLISIALATLATTALVGLWFTLARRFPDADVIRYSSILLRTPLGRLAGTAYLIVLLIQAGRSTAKVGIIGKAAFGWGAAAVIPAFVMIIAALFLLTRRDLKTMASLCEYTAPVAIILVAVAGLTVWSKVDWTNYAFPSTGWGPVIKGAWSLMGRYSAAWVILLLLPRTRHVENSMLSTVATIILVGLLMAIGSLALGLYGAGVVSSSFMPSLQWVTDSIFGRNPVILNTVVVFWMLGMALKTGMAYWLLSIVLAETSSASRWRFLAPVGIAVFVVALLLWNNPAQTYVYLRQAHRYLMYLAGIGIPLLLLLVAWLRERMAVQQPVTQKQNTLPNP